MRSMSNESNVPKLSMILATVAVALMVALAIAPVGAQGAAAAAAPGPVRGTVVGGKAVVMVADLVYAFPEARSTVLAVAGTDQGLGSFLQTVDPRFPSLPVLDRSAGAEAFASLKPDLAILKSSMKKTIGAQVAALGINALYLDLETPEDYYRDIAALGAAYGARARAGQLAGYYRGIVAKVAEGVAASGAAGSARPKVLIVQATLAGGDAFEVPPRAWMQSIMAGMAGGEPVWFGANPGEGWGRVGFEQIAAWNPDLIAVINYRSEAQAIAARLRADPRFSALAAGRSGRIYAFPQDWYSWDQPDTRWGLGLLWLSKVLHPEAFAKVDLVAEAREFYHLFYGFDDARFDRAVLPRLKGDHAVGK